MKLLFLGKRCPMGRDLITRPYGRFFHLPHYLAERGHEVHSLLLDYHKSDPLEFHEQGIHWVSESLRSGRPLQYLKRLRELVEKLRPDWIIGLSDTYYGILAEHYGHKCGARVCIDAYDNYESYIPWMKPLHGLWRRALSRADLVTAAGPDLAQYMSRQRKGRPAVVVPMAADPTGFKPMSQADCRLQMGLPVDGLLVGYCGSLHKNRGIEVLFDAFERLRQIRPEVELVLSGRQSSNVPVPDSARSLGYIQDEKMPLLLNSMDTLVVINQDSAFGRYSHPVKLYEAMTCQIPVVATATPATRWILKDHPECLVRPSQPDELCERLAQNLEVGCVDYKRIVDWNSVCGSFEKALLEQK